MREIKFRAWDTKSKGYFEVDTARWGLDGELIGVSCHLSEIETAHLSASQIVVEQFTGLKDRNGVEIYEGDIVNIKSNYETDEPVDCNAKVFFRDGAFRTDFHDSTLAIALPGYWTVTAIGNVHQNPELLTSPNQIAR